MPTRRRTGPVGCLLLLLGATGAALAQPMPSTPPPALGGHEPPLLYVKLIGPKGMLATFATPGGPGQSFATPCTIGIRPGYCVRLALTGIPGFPDTAFFPALEVCGSLYVSNPA